MPVEGPTTTVLERETAAIEAFRLNAEPPKKKKKPNPTPGYKRPPKESKEQTRIMNEIERLGQPATEEETWFRHTHWKEKRARVRAALAAVATTDTALNRFDQCGADCSVEWSDTEERYRVRANYCKCRHCEPCMKAKANKIAANLQNKLEEEPNKDYRFITFTMKHNSKPLQDQIRDVYRYFKKLRKYKLWSDSQRGGATMLEVKYNPTTFHGDATTTPWHVHLHIISEGTWVSQKELSAAWFAITGDSFKVDIRPVSTSKDAAFYVAKYISKGTNDTVWHSMDAAQEWIIATKGVRTCGTYGSWRGYKLLENPDDDGDWRTIGSLSKIVQQAKTGQPWAVAILRALTDTVQYDPNRKRKPQHTE